MLDTPGRDRYETMVYGRRGQRGLLPPDLSLRAWDPFGGYRAAKVAHAVRTLEVV